MEAAVQDLIAVDLGFGDAGKGLITDYFTRCYGAKLVVRFNGGAQAGHNVVTSDGRHHTFAQIGSGSFVPGVRTFLSRYFVLHPTALLVEAEHLAQKGLPRILERVSISPDSLVITPFHQAAGRLRELQVRHGSCGVGLGEAMRDRLQPDAIRVSALRDRASLVRLLKQVQERKRADISGFGGDPEERAIFEDPAVILIWADKVRSLLEQVTIADDDRLQEPGPIVFEGAQGVLLDENHGFHPHTTWSTCTFDNALALAKQWGREVVRAGVLRSYAVRHGAGPFPTFDPELTQALEEPHNTFGPWQGSFAKGWFDVMTARYAIAACGGADCLALTHLDAEPRIAAWKVCARYRGLKALPIGDGDLERQARLTGALKQAVPEYVPGFATPEFVGETLGLPVRWASRGPRAADVLLLQP